jgi:hypothetical protein
MSSTLSLLTAVTDATADSTLVADGHRLVEAANLGG